MNVTHAPVLQFRHHRQPELGPFIGRAANYSFCRRPASVGAAGDWPRAHGKTGRIRTYRLEPTEFLALQQ